MKIQIGDFSNISQKCIRHFWRAKKKAKQNKKKLGNKDQGERGGATAGKNLNGFIKAITRIVKDASNQPLQICIGHTDVTLPGFFRVAKRWDIVVLDESGRILLAIELKSLGGPSYGNNANNRCEEAIGNAVDFRTAQRDGTFGRGAKPFLGYLILVEDDEKSSRPPKYAPKAPHFENDPIFQGASYQQRMAI